MRKKNECVFSNQRHLSSFCFSNALNPRIIILVLIRYMGNIIANNIYINSLLVDQNQLQLIRTEPISVFFQYNPMK